jgi:hypothetical protein
MIVVADTPDVPASRNRPTFSLDVKEEAEEAMQRFWEGVAVIKRTTGIPLDSDEWRPFPVKGDIPGV